jgi:hypothetical protein
MLPGSELAFEATRVRFTIFRLSSRTMTIPLQVKYSLKLLRAQQNCHPDRSEA